MPRPDLSRSAAFPQANVNDTTQPPRPPTGTRPEPRSDDLAAALNAALGNVPVDRASPHEATFEEISDEVGGNDEQDALALMEERLREQYGARIAELEAEVVQARTEARETYDRLLRTAADFDNFRRRNARERQELARFGHEQFALNLLPVLDNLERAVKHAGADTEAARAVGDGVRLVVSQWIQVLIQFGIQPRGSVGMPFDPVWHQAMEVRYTDDVPPDTVVEELQRGYTIHDRLLRPAMVVVARPTADDPDKPAAAPADEPLIEFSDDPAPGGTD